jgi:16S rRNA (guanine966-N2)-methyltransferase
MRITAGERRGKNLKAPDGLTTRPTSDRARQAVYNILSHAGWRPPQINGGDIIDNALVLDCFAGTGAMGLEALSRGAGHAVFIERDPAAISSCRENITAMGYDGKSLLMKSDALNVTQRPASLEPRTLVFLDPPYGKGWGAECLTGLAKRGWLAPHAICVMEMDRKQLEPDMKGFILHDERSYGVALVRFLEWEG